LDPVGAGEGHDRPRRSPASVRARDWPDATALHVYSPVIRPDDARRSALSHLVDTFFSNSRSSAIATLLDMGREPLSDDEYERLDALLKKARKPKGAK